MRRLRVCHHPAWNPKPILLLSNAADGTVDGVLSRKIFESEVLDTVKVAILQQACCVADAQHMMEQQKKEQEATVALLRKKAKKLEALQRELTQKIEKLYENAVIDNLLSREAYTAQKARLVEQRNDTQKAETEIQAELFEQTCDRSIYVEQYQRYAEIEVLPDDAIADLLDRVTVWSDGRLEVSMKFFNELSVSAVV